jgi:hypothetical protein
MKPTLQGPMLARSALVAIAALVLPAASAFACSSSPPATTPTAQCPPLPSCPTPMPTYADVTPLLQQECVPCHTSNTMGKDESSYAAILGQTDALLAQVGECLMPPAGSPQLTSDQRALLLGWLVCGAPP